MDKKDVLKAQINACERLLKYTKDASERSAVEEEISELRMTRDRMAGGEGAINALDSLPVYAKKIDRRKASFIICTSCYGCASCLNADYTFPRCLQCRDGIVDALSISDDDFYKVEFRENGNVELTFESS